ncbi:hypothetical protein HMPREF1002_02406 [Porphyromonas sp. 31_2]|nr:hypothetical protein HMPREF1002_02406 [Porphyromonas sp. 31_2]
MTEEFVSEVKQIPHNDERIFTMLSDLSNLERIKDRIPQDKIKILSSTAIPVVSLSIPLVRLPSRS